MKIQNILIFINSLTSGGAERVTVNLAAYLARNGYGVTVVTMHGPERDFFRLDGKVRRICLELAGENRGLGKITANIRRIRALRKVIKQEKPDVVLGMMTNCAVMAVLACMGLTSKVLVSERNFPGRKEVMGQWYWLRKLFYRFAHAHAAQTQEAADWLKAHTGARNINIIPNSISWPLPLKEPVQKPGKLLEDHEKLVLAVGSLSRQKGFDLLIEAFADISMNHPDWKLVILGEEGGKDRANGEKKRLENLVEQKGLVGRVLMPGRVGNVGDWYARADIFVLSSRYEGFPNVLLEAMAAGCACVAFDCDTGPRDIITNDFDGLLVEPEAVYALAQEMQCLMDDEALRRRLGFQAMGVRKKFSPERIFGLWEDVLTLGNEIERRQYRIRN